jgi:NADH:ubiquinone oxidoreductase subunit K
MALAIGWPPLLMVVTRIVAAEQHWVQISGDIFLLCVLQQASHEARLGRFVTWF